MTHPSFLFLFMPWLMDYNFLQDAPDNPSDFSGTYHLIIDHRVGISGFIGGKLADIFMVGAIFSWNSTCLASPSHWGGHSQSLMGPQARPDSILFQSLLCPSCSPPGLFICLWDTLEVHQLAQLVLQYWSLYVGKWEVSLTCFCSLAHPQQCDYCSCGCCHCCLWI